MALDRDDGISRAADDRDGEIFKRHVYDGVLDESVRPDAVGDAVADLGEGGPPDIDGAQHREFDIPVPVHEIFLGGFPFAEKIERGRQFGGGTRDGDAETVVRLDDKFRSRRNRIVRIVGHIR